MPVRIPLIYIMKNGQQIPTPEGYPREIFLEEQFSPSEVDEEMVLAQVTAELFLTGAEAQDVVIYWQPINENIH